MAIETFKNLTVEEQLLVAIRNVISGTMIVTVTNPTADPETGLSTEVTQLLAKEVLDNILTKLNDSIAVTGTFWQAIQPISGTVTVNNPTTNPETGLAKTVDLIGGTQQTNLYGSITKVCITATASGDTTIITPGAGKKIRLFKFSYSADGNNAAGTVVALKFGTNPEIDKQWLDPKQPYADGLTMRYYDGGIDEALKINLSAAVSTGIYVNVAYQEI